jgi:hypothetical protein
MQTTCRAITGTNGNAAARNDEQPGGMACASPDSPAGCGRLQFKQSQEPGTDVDTLVTEGVLTKTMSAVFM